MLPFAVVAAIGIAAVLVLHGVIDHFPDAAAHEVRIGEDFLPVRFRVARAHTHGMRILAHEVGAVIEACLLAAVLAHVVHHLHRRVHFAADIIGLALAVDGALIVHGQGGMRLQVVIHGIRIVETAGLIAQGPHEDGGIRVNLVALIKPGDAVDIVAFPLGIMGDGVVAIS